jgi:hypothetical protein
VAAATVAEALKGAVTLVVVADQVAAGADKVADAVLVDKADVDPVVLAAEALVGLVDVVRAENAVDDDQDVTKKTQVSSNAL